MRIAHGDEVRLPSDLTARARIRDAAITCFAQQGFDTPFRTIAERAGVSPGLITHHFRSKDVLRAECDAEVLRRYQALKTTAIGDPSRFLIANLTEPGPAAELTVYLLRAIHAGGRPAEEFLERLIDNARELMAAGVESGLVRPSRDEEARLRLLTYQTMGALLIQLLLAKDSTPNEFVTSVIDAQRAQVLPLLEMFTEGFLATPRMLEDYLDYLAGRPHESVETDAPEPDSA